MEGNALEDPFILLVGKPDVLKLDLSADLLQLYGIRFIHNFRLHIHHSEDLFSRSKGGLEHVELLGQGLDRVEEFGDVQVEGNYGAAGNHLTHEARIFDDAAAAQIEEAEHGGNVQHVDHGPENAEDEDLLLLGALQLFALFEEFLHLAFFAVVDLRDLDAGKVLAEVGVDVRGPILHSAVGTSRELAEDHREEHEERHEAQHHERQLEVQQEHGDKHTDDDKCISHHGDQDVREHEGNGIRIVALTGDQLTDRNVVELGVRKTFDVRKQFLAHGGKDLLPGLLQHHGLDIGADHG